MSIQKESATDKAGNSKPPPGLGKTPPRLPPGLDRHLGGLPPQQWGLMLWYFILVLGALWFWQEAARQFTAHTIPYSEFKDLVAEDRVADLTISDTEITGKVLPKPARAGSANLTPPVQTNALGERESKAASGTNVGPALSKLGKEKPNAAEPEAYLFRTVRVEDPDLVRDLRKAEIEFTGVRPGFMSQFIWSWVVPIAAMVLLWRFVARRMGNIGRGIMGFGSSKAKVLADKDTGVTFNDVAGCDEAKYELQEVVTFLEQPDRYKALGAAIPKGILLIGPPGTGKTLLARAVAGEAKVPFFLISGSDFVEMLGAARVRDLFEKAKEQAPCIVFIDELDAVGRQRGVHMGPVNDEREQTLNQLLVGMDGFETNLGVIVLAATNRPEVLDLALLRPGRFDRQVVVDAPDLEGRLAILKLHVRNKPLATDTELRKIAQQTPGFSGADLANVTNEAALLAARHHATQISQIELEAAVDKIVAGPERSRRLGEEEKRQVAYPRFWTSSLVNFSSAKLWMGKRLSVCSIRPSASQGIKSDKQPQGPGTPRSTANSHYRTYTLL